MATIQGDRDIDRTLELEPAFRPPHSAHQSEAGERRRGGGRVRALISIDPLLSQREAEPAARQGSAEAEFDIGRIES